MLTIGVMFAREIRQMGNDRKILYSKDAQPFLIAGSGTLGWDQVGIQICVTTNRHIVIAWQVSANLVEPGENALVLNCGYFADSFADWYVVFCDDFRPANRIYLACRPTVQKSIRSRLRSAGQSKNPTSSPRSSPRNTKSSL